MLTLECPDFLMNFSNALLIYSSDDMRPNRLLAIYFNLEQHIYIHFIKDDQLVAPVPIGMHLLVQVERISQTGQEERREGQRFSRLSLVLTNGFTSLGDIELYQPMYSMFQKTHSSTIGH